MVHLARPPGAAAYRPDFYTAENIIGYTGKLRDKPTVYFSDPDTGEFGHITQWHKIKANIGRQPVDGVLAGWKYVIENELKSDGTVRAGEYAVNLQTGERIKQIHDSRGQYTDCRRANINVFAILAQAIWLFPNMKTIK
jgi:hypothetical protein